jgi:RNA polymerase sigma-70 factor (ECF subfamily)
MPNLFSRRSRLMGQEGSDFNSGPERPALSDWASALSWGVDETRLVTELQAGSETAFDWLVTHYHAPVYNLILSMLGDVADAADGTQEVFLKAFRGIRSFRRGSSLKTWLYRIAIREALNHKRWFKRHLQKNVSIDAEPEEGHAAIEIEDLAATPFEQFAAHEIQAAVQNALQQIPEVFRSAVILRDLEGLSYEEIAEVLECSAGTVKSRILRGRRALKELLEPLLVDRSAIASSTDRAAVAHADVSAAAVAATDGSASASAGDRAAPTYSGGSGNVGARFSASVSASRAGSSRMPRPAFAPHFGTHRNTVSARSRFARESSASEELP